jgi:hypothetical protein
MLPQDAIYCIGDTWYLPFQLWLDEKKKIPWNLTNNEIRFQLNTPTPIYKATANVSGGSDSEIAIIDAANGIFQIIITNTETSTIAPKDYTMAIKVKVPTGEDFTVLPDTVGVMRVVKESISWGSEP